jgi:transcription elongation factor GreA
MSDIKLITQAGYDKLSAELHHLKTVERPEISIAVGEARDLGDLRENAEYHTGKERQGLIEARINFLEQILIDSQVFHLKDDIHDKSVIHFSASVKIEDLESGNIKNIKLVGENEADIRNNMISVVSPLGIGLLNKSVGDVITFEAPSGTKEYEILEIQY